MSRRPVLPRGVSAGRRASRMAPGGRLKSESEVKPNYHPVGGLSGGRKGFTGLIEVTDRSRPYADEYGAVYYNAKGPQLVKVSDNRAILSWWQAGGDVWEDMPTMQPSIHFRLIDNAGSVPVILDAIDHLLPSADAGMDSNSTGDAGTGMQVPNGDVVFMWANYVSLRDPIGTPYRSDPMLDGGYYHWEGIEDTESVNPDNWYIRYEWPIYLCARVGMSGDSLSVKWIHRLGAPFPLVWEDFYGDWRWEGPLNNMMQWSPVTNSILLLSAWNDGGSIHFNHNAGQWHPASVQVAVWPTGTTTNTIQVSGNRWVAYGDDAYAKGTISPFTISGPHSYPLSVFGAPVLFVNQGFNGRYDSDGNFLALFWLQPGADPVIDNSAHIGRFSIDGSGDPVLIDAYGSNTTWWWYNPASQGYPAPDGSNYGPTNDLWARSWMEVDGEMAVVPRPDGGLGLFHFGYSHWDYSKSQFVIFHGLDEMDTGNFNYNGWANVAYFAPDGASGPWSPIIWEEPEGGYWADWPYVNCVWVGGKYLMSFSVRDTPSDVNYRAFITSAIV